MACAALAAGCAAPVSPDDAGDAMAMDGSDMGDGDASDIVVDAPDPHMGLRLPRCEDTEPLGEPALAPVASTLLGTIVPMAARVAIGETGLSPVQEIAEMGYRTRGFDQFRRGAAQARVLRTDLGAASAHGVRRSMAYFVHWSDMQLVDDESPSRLALLNSPDANGGIRPQEAFLPRAVSAMNRTLAALARPERPLMFGVFAGDCADSAQLNELQWFMQVMNGATRVKTDSGDVDDPIPGPDNDPKDAFDATAFPAPWYFVPGNHDVEVVGVAPPTEMAQARAIGNYSSFGTRDYTQWYAPPRRGQIAADAHRRVLLRGDIVRELQTGPTTPGPAGHGFGAMTDVSLGANYTRDVVPNLLRLVALDTSDDTGGSPGLVHRATIDRWLRPELDRAQRDGMLVMIASHHPTTSVDQLAGEAGALVADAVSPREIEQIVAGYPNVILWLVGICREHARAAAAG